MSIWHHFRHLTNVIVDVAVKRLSNFCRTCVWFLLDFHWTSIQLSSMIRRTFVICTFDFCPTFVQVSFHITFMVMVMFCSITVSFRLTRVPFHSMSMTILFNVRHHSIQHLSSFCLTSILVPFSVHRCQFVWFCPSTDVRSQTSIHRSSPSMHRILQTIHCVTTL
jgi:hypothetical protein